MLCRNAFCMVFQFYAFLCISIDIMDSHLPLDKNFKSFTAQPIGMKSKLISAGNFHDRNDF